MTLITGIFGLSRLNELSHFYSNKNILLVTGKTSFEKCGAKQIFNDMMKSEKVCHFSDFSVNPKFKDAKRGVEIARSVGIEVIIAVGGGSVIDIAKLIKAFYLSQGHEEDLVKGKVSVVDPMIPIIAVPTTAGSGSEATHFAVVYIKEEKYSLASKCLLPEAIILDGSLTTSISKYQNTCNALDALSQGIESFWAKDRTIESIKFSKKAINLCGEFITANRDSIEVRQRLMLASNFAGRAINISKTTSAHAWSYAFTSKFNIPHGHAIWLTLPNIFQIHSDRATKMLCDFSKTMQELIKLLNLDNSKNLSKQLKIKLDQLNIEHRFQYLKISKKERRVITSQVNLERMKNNPIVFNKEEIRKIFELH